MNYNSRPRYPPGIGNGRGSGGGGNYAHQNPNFQSRPPYHQQQQHHNQPHYIQKNSTQQNQYQNQHQQPQQQQQWMMRRPANFTDSNSSVATTQSTSTEVIQSPQSHVDSRYSLSRSLSVPILGLVVCFVMFLAFELRFCCCPGCCVMFLAVEEER